jgi:hypothetical protein
MKNVVSIQLPSGTIVSVSEPNNSTANNVGPYGTGVSLTDPVSEPPKSGNYIGPYGAGVDQNDR